MALQISLASPCSEKWESMAGDERRRFCAKCKLHVHNLSSLNDEETTELLRGATGRVCGRVFQRADGTVLTKDCPVGVATLRRRMVMSMVAVAAVFVACAGLISGAAPSAHKDDDGAVSMTFRQRYVEAREYLRSTALFGPLINRFSPMPMVMGEISIAP